MILFWSIATASLLFSAFVVAVVPARWLLRSILLWLVSPIPGYVIMIVWDSFGRTHTPHAMSNALLGFSLLSAFLLIPWLVFCGTGFVLGFLLRGIVRRVEPADPIITPTFADGTLHVAKPAGDYGREPHPWAAWRAALLILIAAVVAIAGMTYLSLHRTNLGF